MGRLIEVRKVPSKIMLEAFLSGSAGGQDSYGGLDGLGPMVVVDLERREMVPVEGFQERLESWRKGGGIKLFPLRRKPTLEILNAFLNHKGPVYNLDRREIVKI